MDTSTLPTKNNLIRIQGKIKLSKQGQELLEKKKTILTIEKNKYENQKEQLEQEIKKDFNKAYNKFKQASIEIGIDSLLDIASKTKEEDTINIKFKSVMGVEIPSIIYEPKEPNLDYEFYKTMVSTDEVILEFNKLKPKIIKLAELENTIFRLDKSIAKVQKRSNALKDIIIPEDEDLEKDIKNILEEREREEFSRLKMLKK